MVLGNITTSGEVVYIDVWGYEIASDVEWYAVVR